MKTDDVVARALSQIHDLDRVTTELRRDPDAVLRASRATRSIGALESLGGTAAAGPGAYLLTAGAAALQKLRDEGPKAELSDQQRIGLEAVIHAVGRPALLVQDGTFPEPPVGWEILEDYREPIES